MLTNQIKKRDIVINNQHHSNAGTHKKLSSPNISWNFVIPPPGNQETNPYDAKPILNSEKGSFITDWELPQMGGRLG